MTQKSDKVLTPAEVADRKKLDSIFKASRESAMRLPPEMQALGEEAMRQARQTTSGVAGIGTSSWPTASVIALITAGGAAIAPASPHPLMPSGFDGHGVTVMPTTNDGRSPARGMR